MNGNIFYVIVIISLLLFSCQPKKENLTFEHMSSNLSIKALNGRILKDSTLIGVFVPQEFILNSQGVKFSRIHFSLTGANVFFTNNSKIYAVKKDTLLYEPTEVKMYWNVDNKYKVYVSYYFYINNSEKNIIFDNSEYVQTKYNRDIFNLKSTNKLKEILNKKIPDSLKGYIHLNYTNPKTEQFDYLNIPVEF
ncbi:hypothetical protein F6U93_10110 [Tamlana haliotis]|uniref:Uncharacterized protein n=1 Tax=Pseudotamlana haliotis TaxID=2614804 RepID=A0A6N6MFR6_9FLAO|nr:hypothetical protein [Tamlana haliotis]KAB1067630.1 hypothetical protein F6U93_10110 [Tamlana haliotis]